MSWKGKFKPKNPGKYRGDAGGIVYRSSLELKVMRRFDSSPDVLWWASEEMHVPYYDPSTKRPRRYFPDFLFCRRDANGREKVFMVEVKPASQVKPPTHRPGKKRARVISEELTWATNKAKWDAAREFCARNGWEFMTLTDREIGKSY